MHRTVLLLPLAIVACVDPPDDEPTTTTAPAAIAGPVPNPAPVPAPVPWPIPDHVITENADGTFTPMWTYAHDGELIQWNLASRTGAVVPINFSNPWPAPCTTPKPWSDTDVNNVAGPRPGAETGVYTLGPVPTNVNPTAAGLVSQAGACPAGTQVGHETDYLCATGAPYATASTTWQNPNVDGVFIRLLWNQLEPTDCSSTNLATCWNWTALDRELNAAVANGKTYSIGVKAGNDGTPDWLFTTTAAGVPRAISGGVRRLHLQDSGNDTAGCGPTMDLGDPTQTDIRMVQLAPPPAPPVAVLVRPYRSQYFDMLTALAAHIKTRGDWYRALAAVKPSGANLESHENRLPKRCDTSNACVCNTQVLAANGYTPSKLYDFYQAQYDLLAALFPGKAQSYALIQQGFPRITSASCYQIDDAAGVVQASAGCAGGVADLPLPQTQTQTLVDLGAATAASAAVPFVWSVSHNGLGEVGPNNMPNQMVLDTALADATTLTGFQTNNGTQILDTVMLDSTFVNLRDNAPEATWLEIYEDKQWASEQQPDHILDPAGSNLTLGGWSDFLRLRRQLQFAYVGAATPSRHQARVHYTIASGNQIIHFVDPAKCGGAGFRYGALSISP